MSIRILLALFAILLIPSVVGAATPECNDGIDNDGDTLIDYPEDPGCQGSWDDYELGTAACDDGIDNDGDTLIDYPEDPGCFFADSDIENPVCNDGQDNDVDALTDMLDLGCDAPWDDSERGYWSICDDGIDNDCDLSTDYRTDLLGDPGCSHAGDSSEKSPLLACDDGIDNDGDGKEDYKKCGWREYSYGDTGCSSPRSLSEEPDCADGFDNDGDGEIDHPNDPGCRMVRVGDSCVGNINACNRDKLPTEDPQCNDGADNDGDGHIDMDDPECRGAYWHNEGANIAQGGSCGIGFELAFILPPLMWLRRRKKRQAREQ